MHQVQVQESFNENFKEIFVLSKFNEILHHYVAVIMSSCLLKDVV